AASASGDERGLSCQVLHVRPLPTARATDCDKISVSCCTIHLLENRASGIATRSRANGAMRESIRMAIAPTSQEMAAESDKAAEAGKSMPWPSEKAGFWTLFAVVFATFVTFLDQTAFGLLAEKMKISFGISDFVLGLLLG